MEELSHPPTISILKSNVSLIGKSETARLCLVRTLGGSDGGLCKFYAGQNTGVVSP
jgi:hypothetical protein